MMSYSTVLYSYEYSPGKSTRTRTVRAQLALRIRSLAPDMPSYILI